MIVEQFDAFVWQDQVWYPFWIGVLAVLVAADRGWLAAIGHAMVWIGRRARR